MRTLSFFTALFIFVIGGVMITRQPSAEAQQPVSSPGGDAESRFDAKIERVEDKLQVAESIKPEPAKAPAVKRYIQKRKMPQVCNVSTVTIRTDTAVYQVPATFYGGTAVIDGKDLAEVLQHEVEYLDIEPEVPTPPKRKLFQRIGDFITKPFKKHDQ